MLVPNCPGAKLSGCQIVHFYYLGAKLSALIILVPNCPLYYLGAKLSGAKLSGAKLSGAKLSLCLSIFFLSFCLFIILSFCRPLFFSFCLYVISSLWLSAFLSNCLSVLVHLSSRRSSWYHTGLISSFRGSVGMEWMWWSSLVNGQQSSKSTFGPNNVFCASLESPYLFCLIPEGICSTTTHLIRCRLGSILQSLLVP